MTEIIISNPKRPLDEAVRKSKFELFCERIAPYVIVVGLFILTVLLFVALVKYGAGITGTEANTLQRLELII